jgi:tetratricopeptide (TPR) repeat protein
MGKILDKQEFFEKKRHESMNRNLMRELEIIVDEVNEVDVGTGSSNLMKLLDTYSPVQETYGAAVGVAFQVVTHMKGHEFTNDFLEEKVLGYLDAEIKRKKVCVIDSIRSYKNTARFRYNIRRYGDLDTKYERLQQSRTELYSAVELLESHKENLTPETYKGYAEETYFELAETVYTMARFFFGKETYQLMQEAERLHQEGLISTKGNTVSDIQEKVASTYLKEAASYFKKAAEINPENYDAHGMAKNSLEMSEKPNMMYFFL